MSDWDVTIDPNHLTHTFTPNNIAFVDGALDLKVNRYTGGKVVGAEMGTTFKFKYGSVRTYLKSSTTPGVCEGNFLYGKSSSGSRCKLRDAEYSHSGQVERSRLGNFDQHHRCRQPHCSKGHLGHEPGES